jgi:phospholipase/carboxylesterase
MSDIRSRGLPLHQANKVIVMIHGRGATAESILSLGSYLNLTDYAILAPQANGNTWYPYGFMASDQGNAASLERSIEILKDTHRKINSAGIPDEKIVWLGFSQGACLSLEYTSRHARRWGGVVAFTGGLIGESLDKKKYTGDFQRTPIFIGSSERDFHVPAKRINDSVDLLRNMGADITVKLYDDPDHTIRAEEINWVNQNVFL